MPIGTQRSAFAFDVAARRIAVENQRGAWARVGLLLVVVVGLVLGRSPWWSAALVLPAAVGTIQALGLSRAFARSEEPRSPLVRWAWRSAAAAYGTSHVNISGTLEGAGCIGLVAAGPWCAHGEVWQLLVLAAGVLYAVSTFTAVFLDPAFYNPEEEPPALLEVARAAAGPILVVLALVPTLPPLWGASGTYEAAALDALLLVVSLRVRDADVLAGAAGAQAVRSEVTGRNLVLAQVHAGLSGALNVAATYARRRRQEDPGTYDAVRVARAHLQQLGQLDDAGVRDVLLPGSLVRPVAWIARSWGVLATTRIAVTTLSDADHDTARIVLDDLVTNAAKAGASRVDVTLSRHGGQLEILVEDDADPFPPGAWRAPGSSLARLGAILTGLRGDLRLDEGPRSKTVTATWAERQQRAERHAAEEGTDER